MRILSIAAFALAVGLGATAHAQPPSPFSPRPDLSGRPQCTRDYVRSVGTLARALEKLRAASPDAIGQLCSLIELGSAWLGGKLSDEARADLRRLLGVDVDIELLTAQCRSGQDGIERELSAMLQRLRAELARCDDTI